MNTLIIYDSTGYIIQQMSGNVREPIGVPFIWVDIPQEEIVTSIDVSVTPHQPVLEMLPPSAEDRLVSVEEALTALMGV